MHYFYVLPRIKRCVIIKPKSINILFHFIYSENIFLCIAHNSHVLRIYFYAMFVVNTIMQKIYIHHHSLYIITVLFIHLLFSRGAKY